MPSKVNPIPAASGASDVFCVVAAATTNATLLKVGQTLLTGYAITNTSAALTYICFHDTGGPVVAGQQVRFKFGIPASGAANVSFPGGILFSRGLAISTVTGIALSNATAVAANDQLISIMFK